MVRSYAAPSRAGVGDDELVQGGASNGRMTRGGRSGRVAWQFIQDVAGRLGKQLEAWEKRKTGEFPSPDG